MAGLKNRNGEQRSAEIWGSFKAYVRNRRKNGQPPLPLKGSGSIHVSQIEKETGQLAIEQQRCIQAGENFTPIETISKINRNACYTNKAIARYVRMLEASGGQKQASEAAKDGDTGKGVSGCTQAVTGASKGNQEEVTGKEESSSFLKREVQRLKSKILELEQKNYTLNTELNRARLKNNSYEHELKTAMPGFGWYKEPAAGNDKTEGDE